MQNLFSMLPRSGFGLRSALDSQVAISPTLIRSHSSQSNPRLAYSNQVENGFDWLLRPTAYLLRGELL